MKRTTPHSYKPVIQCKNTGLSSYPLKILITLIGVIQTDRSNIL